MNCESRETNTERQRRSQQRQQEDRTHSFQKGVLLAKTVGGREIGLEELGKPERVVCV